MNSYCLVSILCFNSLISVGQNSDYNQKSGYVAAGYDVVAYFDKAVKKGKEDLVFTYEGANFSFSNAANLNRFKSDPDVYIPQYGGWCAYAMGKNGKKVKIDPETYEIRDGKLYLFYNFRATNTLNSWLAEGAGELRAKADKNWNKLRLKNK